MTKKFVLEVCTYSFQSCIIAEKAGAERVELCDNQYEGGTTPSYGVIRQARESIGIELYPIIRPRGGNFVYDEAELAVMKHDIEVCKELHCDGISTGVQLSNGAIDKEAMMKIVQWAYPMKVTCHRVFDFTPDPFKALEDLIQSGCIRILTSGQEILAVEGIDVISKLVKAAGGRISIMPGAGVRASNNEYLVRKSGASEFHTSAKKKSPDAANTIKSDLMYLGHHYIADEAEIKNIISIGNKMLKSK